MGKQLPKILRQYRRIKEHFERMACACAMFAPCLNTRVKPFVRQHFLINVPAFQVVQDLLLEANTAVTVTSIIIFLKNKTYLFPPPSFASHLAVFELTVCHLLQM